MNPGFRPRILRIFVVVMAMLLAACSPDPTVGPSGTPAGDASGRPSPAAAADGPGSPTTPPADSTAEPPGAVDPVPSGWPTLPVIKPIDPDADLALAPLPQPSMTEPSAIGQALYDPGRVPDAVVSLLRLMGIGIYSADGSPIRRGSEHAPDDVWLSEAEVRGLIEMGVADLAGGDAETLPYHFSDLATALAPMVPGWSAERLAAAYQQAYEARPDDLVPRVMLGQPIEPGIPLTRVHIWLLLLDGFLAPAASAGILPGVELAAAGSSWGTAHAGLPALDSPDTTYSQTELLQLLPHLVMLAWNIPFTIDPPIARAHEGHGRPGPLVTIAARVGLGSRATPAPSSPISGRIIIRPRVGPAADTYLRWFSKTESTLRAHGSADFEGAVRIDATGAATTAYQVRKEDGDQTGPVVSDAVDFTAQADLRSLVSAAYVLPAGVQGLLMGVRQVSGRVRVSWHAVAGIMIRLANEYDTSLSGQGCAGRSDPTCVSVDLGFGGSATGNGVDTVVGSLEKKPDGSYRGYVDAEASGTFEGEWGGQTCTRHHDAQQRLFVVGVPTGGDSLQLSFYPASAPQAEFTDNSCPKDAPWQLSYDGGGPYEAGAAARTWGYIPFGNAAWNSPAVGFIMKMPTASDPILDTVDDHESGPNGDSTWRIYARLLRAASP